MHDDRNGMGGGVNINHTKQEEQRIVSLIYAYILSVHCAKDNAVPSMT